MPPVVSDPEGPLHEETHINPGKLTHPGCLHCQDEVAPERLEADAARRRLLGLL